MHKALYTLMRDHYRALQGYVSAGMEVDKAQDLTFMNANENPYDLPGLEGFNRYPEPQPKALLEAYAQSYHVKADNIVMTRGADEAIALLVKLFCEPNKDSIIINPPTFGMYSVNANAAPVNVIEAPLLESDNGSFILDAKTIITRTKDPETSVKIVFLCSPNNPTGTSFELERMIYLCKELEGHALVIIDETYIEFATQGSMCAYLDELPNLIVLRSLSKSYSMAGMRMGALLAGDTEFIKLVREKALDAYPLPKPSIEAALRALQPGMRDTVMSNIEKLRAERDRMIPLLNESSLVRHIYPSDANFLLIRMERAKNFIDHCACHKVILRDFSSKPLTKNCIRISIGTPEQNDHLLTLFMAFEKRFLEQVTL